MSGPETEMADVEIILQSDCIYAQAIAALKSLGVQIEEMNEEEGEIEGAVPLDKIGAIQKLACVAHVRTVFRYEEEADEDAADDDGGFHPL